MSGTENVIGRRIRQARETAGLTQTSLGKAAGLDEHSASARITQYESGKHAPDYSTAQRLAVALAVPTAFLYCDDDEIADLLALIHGLPIEERSRLIEHLSAFAAGGGH